MYIYVHELAIGLDKTINTMRDLKLAKQHKKYVVRETINTHQIVVLYVF